MGLERVAGENLGSGGVLAWQAVLLGERGGYGAKGRAEEDRTTRPRPSALPPPLSSRGVYAVPGVVGHAQQASAVALRVVRYLRMPCGNGSLR